MYILNSILSFIAILDCAWDKGSRKSYWFFDSTHMMDCVYLSEMETKSHLMIKFINQVYLWQHTSGIMLELVMTIYWSLLWPYLWQNAWKDGWSKACRRKRWSFYINWVLTPNIHLVSMNVKVFGDWCIADFIDRNNHLFSLR